MAARDHAPDTNASALHGAVTEAAHSPGPWEAVGNEVGPEDSLMVIARVTTYDRATTANARLIAAAPDLLAALQPLADCEIIDCDEPLRDSDSGRYFMRIGEIRAARAAIAKALGVFTASPATGSVQATDEP